MSREAKQALGCVILMVVVTVLVMGAFDIIHGWQVRDRVRFQEPPVKMGEPN